MCRVLKVSRSGFYDWCTRAPSAHALEDRSLTQRIQQIHERNRQANGVIKIPRELRAQGCVAGTIGLRDSSARRAFKPGACGAFGRPMSRTNCPQRLPMC